MRVVMLLDAFMGDIVERAAANGGKYPPEQSVSVSEPPCSRVARFVDLWERARVDTIDHIVVDPELIDPTDGLIDCMIQDVGQQRTRIVLFSRVSSLSLKAVHALGSKLESTLVILGLDHEGQLRELLKEPTLGPRSAKLLAQVTARASGLAPTLVETLCQVVKAPREWTVKRIVVETHMSKSSLDRRCRSSNVPTPARILSLARRAMALDGIDAGMKGSAAARSVGWGDDRPLRRASQRDTHWQ